MSIQLEKRAFTSDEYHRMGEAGILSEDDRVELIEGEIIQMSPIGKHHASCVNRLNRILNMELGALAIISVQNPIRIGNFSEPQPDIVLLKPRTDFYAEQAPTAEDVLLLIEVADTSIEYDRTVKIPLYAAANISEVWIVNLQEGQVEVYSEPAGHAAPAGVAPSVHGAYQNVQHRLSWLKRDTQRYL
ncbi:MAG: Uma2 family endonuclease [Nitrospirota bacterium]